MIDRTVAEDGTVKFLLSLRSPLNATIRRGTGVVSIVGDPMPALAAADVAVAGAPQAAADIHVTLSRPTHRTDTATVTITEDDDKPVVDLPPVPSP